jgi:hypothetical protein
MSARARALAEAGDARVAPVPLPSIPASSYLIILSLSGKEDESEPDYAGCGWCGRVCGIAGRLRKMSWGPIGACYVLDVVLRES